jgi:hypothetical protein
LLNQQWLVDPLAHSHQAAELHMPPGGGNPEDIHQHTLDYGLVFVGERVHIKVWGPGADGKSVLIKDDHLQDGSAVFKSIEEGDLSAPYAVHALTNGSKTDWLRCYQVELK